MNNSKLTFHHLGLAVTKPEKAIQFLTNLGYSIGSTVKDELQNVNLIMCTGNNMPDVEIIFPSDTKGPLDKMLTERSEMIYHVCYQTPNIEESVRKMKEENIHAVCVSRAKPAVLFGLRNVAFYHVAGFGLIELLEM